MSQGQILYDFQKNSRSFPEILLFFYPSIPLLFGMNPLSKMKWLIQLDLL